MEQVSESSKVGDDEGRKSEEEEAVNGGSIVPSGQASNGFLTSSDPAFPSAYLF